MIADYMLSFGMFRVVLLPVLVVSLVGCLATSPKKLREADYVRSWCKGEVEHVLKDSTRVDCLTDEYAIEFDFAKKWAEAVGQSLHYARMTGKKPGIVLILREPGEQRFLKRLMPLADQQGIKVWTLGSEFVDRPFKINQPPQFDIAPPIGYNITKMTTRENIKTEEARGAGLPRARVEVRLNADEVEAARAGAEPLGLSLPAYVHTLFHQAIPAFGLGSGTRPLKSTEISRAQGYGMSRTEALKIWVSRAEKHYLELEARKLGLSVSDYTRSLILREKEG